MLLDCSQFCKKKTNENNKIKVQILFACKPKYLTIQEWGMIENRLIRKNSSKTVKKAV
jgi:hypothetical protein